jgi:hypothetical protein
MTLAKQREHDALALRQKGWTYERIAESLGLSRQGAADAVKRSLAALKADCAERAEDVRELELRRLDRMLELAEAAAESGDISAIDRVLRIQERRSKYLGLDAPVKSEAQVAIAATVSLEGVSDVQLAALERAYLSITGAGSSDDAED